MIELSVIIPHYNSPEKLRRMLESLPIRKELQIIVVDDISTQGIREYEALKAEYSDKAEFYENIPESKSAGGARNIGISHAKGRWILFGDADDYYEQNMWNIVSRYFDTSYDIVYFPPRAVMDDGSLTRSARADGYRGIARKSHYKSIFREERLFNEARLRFAWPVPWSKMIRRSLIEEHNIRFECIKYGNDSVFSAKAGVHANKVYASTHTIYVATEGTGSLRFNADPAQQDMRQAARDRAKAYIKDNGERLLAEAYLYPDRHRGPYRKLKYMIKARRKRNKT